MAALFFYSLDMRQGWPVTKRTISQVFAVLVVLLMLTAGQSGAQERPSRGGAGLTEARALFKDGKFQEALTILRRWRRRTRGARMSVSSLDWWRSRRGGGRESVPPIGMRCWTKPSLPCVPCSSISPGCCVCGWSWPGPFSTRERTACRRNTSSVCWRGTRRSRWWPMSGASFRKSGRAGAGTCTWALRWRRIPISAAPPTKEPSTSSGCRSAGMQSR